VTRIALSFGTTKSEANEDDRRTTNFQRNGNNY
jgi:hypothetical protein